MLKSIHTVFANTLDKDSRMPFGKYKDRTLLQIYIENPKYLRWLFNNTDFLQKNKVDIAFINQVFKEY